MNLLIGAKVRRWRLTRLKTNVSTHWEKEFCTNRDTLTITLPFVNNRLVKLIQFCCNIRLLYQNSVFIFLNLKNLPKKLDEIATFQVLYRK